MSEDAASAQVLDSTPRDDDDVGDNDDDSNGNRAEH